MNGFPFPVKRMSAISSAKLLCTTDRLSGILWKEGSKWSHKKNYAEFSIMEKVQSSREYHSVELKGKMINLKDTQSIFSDFKGGRELVIRMIK